MGSHPLAGPRRDLRTFGWQGILLTVPSDWQLVATSGDHDRGYVRLADDAVARLELTWERGPSSLPPGPVVARALGRLRKDLRGKHAEPTVQRDTRLASPPGKDVECYRWVADRQSVGMVSRCPTCGRTVHVHLLGGPAEGLTGLARTVFSSLRDHADDGRQRWSFFDTDFVVPDSMRLTEHSLRVGCVRMLFRGAAGRLEFARVSLAQLALADHTLEGWFREFHAPRLRWRAVGMQRADLHGHEGLAAEGRPGLLANPAGLVGRRRAFRAACWHCEPTNRLMVCSWEGPAGAADVFAEALDGFRCCEGG